ncbi:unnamed protein product [Vitrella brassicaformis CCMP3155]|uniref:PHD-type domain-containing protein n=2 Tax=Vitrella brassicaformis TaxID=1169539 RepID=A0A0G4EXJ7_VITBC|nr:unnamed protein product [Vitrella brassicaformis CCMP3155]|eukprot:CEM03324.1 unnamed protein product [Vitrella brassicaformis CCMP3155]
MEPGFAVRVPTSPGPASAVESVNAGTIYPLKCTASIASQRADESALLQLQKNTWRRVMRRIQSMVFSTTEIQGKRLTEEQFQQQLLPHAASDHPGIVAAVAIFSDEDRSMADRQIALSGLLEEGLPAGSPIVTPPFLTDWLDWQQDVTTAVRGSRGLGDGKRHIVGIIVPDADSRAGVTEPSQGIGGLSAVCQGLRQEGVSVVLVLGSCNRSLGMLLPAVMALQPKVLNMERMSIFMDRFVIPAIATDPSMLPFTLPPSHLQAIADTTTLTDLCRTLWHLLATYVTFHPCASLTDCPNDHKRERIVKGEVALAPLYARHTLTEVQADYVIEQTKDKPHARTRLALVGRRDDDRACLRRSMPRHMARFRMQREREGLGMLVFLELELFWHRWKAKEWELLQQIHRKCYPDDGSVPSGTAIDRMLDDRTRRVMNLDQLDERLQDLGKLTQRVRELLDRELGPHTPTPNTRPSLPPPTQSGHPPATPSRPARPSIPALSPSPMANRQPQTSAAAAAAAAPAAAASASASGQPPTAGQRQQWPHVEHLRRVRVYLGLLETAARPEAAPGSQASRQQHRAWGHLKDNVARRSVLYKQEGGGRPVSQAQSAQRNREAEINDEAAKLCEGKSPSALAQMLMYTLYEIMKTLILRPDDSDRFTPAGALPLAAEMMRYHRPAGEVPRSGPPTVQLLDTLEVTQGGMRRLEAISFVHRLMPSDLRESIAMLELFQSYAGHVVDRQERHGGLEGQVEVDPHLVRLRFHGTLWSLQQLLGAVRVQQRGPEHCVRRVDIGVAQGRERCGDVSSRRPRGSAGSPSGSPVKRQPLIPTTPFVNRSPPPRVGTQQQQQQRLMSPPTPFKRPTPRMPTSPKRHQRHHGITAHDDNDDELEIVEEEGDFGGGGGGGAVVRKKAGRRDASRSGRSSLRGGLSPVPFNLPGAPASGRPAQQPRATAPPLPPLGERHAPSPSPSPPAAPPPPPPRPPRRTRPAHKSPTPAATRLAPCLSRRQFPGRLLPFLVRNIRRVSRRISPQRQAKRMQNEKMQPPEPMWLLPRGGRAAKGERKGGRPSRVIPKWPYIRERTVRERRPTAVAAAAAAAAAVDLVKPKPKAKKRPRAPSPSPSPSLSGQLPLDICFYCPKKLAEANTDSSGRVIDDDLVPCDICDSYECSEGENIIFCDGGCGTRVHDECYGFTTKPTEDGPPWICRACSHRRDREAQASCSPTAPEEPMKCVLCWREGHPPLVPTDDGRWAHHRCALWVPETWLRRDGEQGHVVVDVAKVPASRWKQTCHTCGCKGVGAPIQCSWPHCRVAYHASCLRDAGDVLLFYYEKTPGQVVRGFLCPTHAASKDQFAALLHQPKSRKLTSGPSRTRKKAKKYTHSQPQSQPQPQPQPPSLPPPPGPSIPPLLPPAAAAAAAAAPADAPKAVVPASPPPAENLPSSGARVDGLDGGYWSTKGPRSARRSGRSRHQTEEEHPPPAADSPDSKPLQPRGRKGKRGMAREDGQATSSEGMGGEDSGVDQPVVVHPQGGQGEGRERQSDMMDVDMEGGEEVAIRDDQVPAAAEEEPPLFVSQTKGQASADVLSPSQVPAAAAAASHPAPPYHPFPAAKKKLPTVRTGKTIPDQPRKSGSKAARHTRGAGGGRVTRGGSTGPAAAAAAGDGDGRGGRRGAGESGAEEYSPQWVAERLLAMPVEQEPDKQQIFSRACLDFGRWKEALVAGFSLCVSGIGSKQALLDKFDRRCLSDSSRLVLYGHDVRLDAVEPLRAPLLRFMETPNAFAGVQDIASKAAEARGRSLKEIVQVFSECVAASQATTALVVHGIDGPRLRDTRTLRVLAHLAQLPKLLLVMSVDEFDFWSRSVEASVAERLNIYGVTAHTWADYRHELVAATQGQVPSYLSTLPMPSVEQRRQQQDKRRRSSLGACSARRKSDM